MKKIAILGGIVILLIVVIKIGSSFMEPSEKETKEGTVTTEESSPALDGQTTTAVGEKVTIEISNGTGASETTSGAEDPTETLAGETPAESMAQTPAETAKAEAGTAEYPVTPMESRTMYATRSVHIRKGCSTDSEIVSGLAPGQKVTATGESSNGWIRISFNGGEAFVYKTYLSTNKADVVVETTAAKKTTTPKTTNAPKNTSAAQNPTTQAAQPGGAGDNPAPPTAGSNETIAPFPGG